VRTRPPSSSPQAQTGQPVGIITDADVSRAVADGENPNDVRTYELMTNPAVVPTKV